MKKVLVIFDNSIYYWKWLLPLKWCKKEFKKKKIKIEFENNIRLKIIYNTLKKRKTEHNYKSICKILKKKYDIIILSFHYNHSILNVAEDEREKIFKMIHKYCDSLVWLDPSDSTGTTTFSVLPYVDLYLKKQLLKNKRLYFNHIYGNRLYTEYYHNIYQLSCDDNYTASEDILKPEYLNKIGVSWNVGVGYLSIEKFKMIDTIKAALGLKGKYTIPNIKEYYRKDLDIFFNGTYEGNGALLYQRKITTELINSVKSGKVYAPSNKIKRIEYLKCMNNCKLSISPFGYGEICYRDFETFIFGGCLVKPSMCHVETWPNYYEDNYTYKSVSWSFDNFYDIISDFKKNMHNYKEIAEQGTLNYLNYDLHFSKNRLKFVEHFISIMHL